MPGLSKNKLVQSVLVLADLHKRGKLPTKAYQRGLANIKKELDAKASALRKSRITAARTLSIHEMEDEVLHGTMTPTEFVAYLHVMDHDSGRYICSLCKAGSCPRRNLIA